MTITTNFPTGPRLIVAGSRFAAVFGRLGLALSAKRLAMPNLTGWFNTIMLAGGGAFFPAAAAAVCPVPTADVARARSRARTRTL